MKITNKDDILGTWFDAAITTHPRYLCMQELLFDIEYSLTFDNMK